MKTKSSYVNPVTESLKPYPMEELAKIRADLVAANKKIYNFGTGDPKIPTWDLITKKLKDSIPKVSQYPTIRGSKELSVAQKDYLKRRLDLDASDSWGILPTRGSKEAIFHIALTLVGRNNKKRIIYPNPGYPVYRSSIQFSGGIPTPYDLTLDNDFLLEPWTLSKDIISDTAAIWVNYPHNPTGKTVNNEYWEKLIEWCHANDVILLSDDCYLDIYSGEKPNSPIALSTDRVLSFMSLSKRSGLTGYRSGFIAGDSKIIEPITKARANFGLGQIECIQNASEIAWSDDQHVEVRRIIFNERVDFASQHLIRMGLLKEKPKATFYIWCKIPDGIDPDDVKFCLSLAQKGFICSPSSWLSEGITGWFRLALVPDLEETKEAFEILEEHIGQLNGRK